MNFAELKDLHDRRIDYAENCGAIYEGRDGDMRLTNGDKILLTGEWRGWTTREATQTPLVEYADRKADYVRHYWLCAWSGVTPNRALAELQAKREREERDKQRRREKFGPPGEYLNKSFDDFLRTTPERDHAAKAALGWPELPENSLNLVLSGPVGTGKTHLASAVFDWAFDASESAEFISATALVRKFRESPKQESALFARYGDGDASDDPDDYGCSTLILDDFGIGADRYSAEVFNEILDRRVAHGLETVVTTNCDEEELLNWLGERGMSRLQHRCLCVEVLGEDYRAKL